MTDDDPRPSEDTAALPKTPALVERLRKRFAGTLLAAEDADLTAPSGERWDAEED